MVSLYSFRATTRSSTKSNAAFSPPERFLYAKPRLAPFVKRKVPSVKGLPAVAAPDRGQPFERLHRNRADDQRGTCRRCEKISQPPAPFHPTPRGWAGPNLLATILFEKYGQHQPLNRQRDRYAREGVDLSLSTLADHACRAAGSTTMPFASSFTRSPTTSATSCAPSRCPMPSHSGH